MMITRIMLVMIMVRMLIGLDRNIDVNANIVNSDNNGKQITIIVVMVIRMSIMRIMIRMAMMIITIVIVTKRMPC